MKLEELGLGLDMKDLLESFNIEEGDGFKDQDLQENTNLGDNGAGLGEFFTNMLVGESSEVSIRQAQAGTHDTNLLEHIVATRANVASVQEYKDTLELAKLTESMIIDVFGTTAKTELEKEASGEFVGLVEGYKEETGVFSEEDASKMLNESTLDDMVLSFGGNGYESARNNGITVDLVERTSKIILNKKDLLKRAIVLRVLKLARKDKNSLYKKYELYRKRAEELEKVLLHKYSVKALSEIRREKTTKK